LEIARINFALMGCLLRYPGGPAETTTNRPALGDCVRRRSPVR